MIWFIVIYLLSILRNYFWFKNAYSSGGTWSMLEPSFTEIFWTLMPFVNTIFALQVSTVSFSGKESKSNTSKFFNIKK